MPFLVNLKKILQLKSGTQKFATVLSHPYFRTAVMEEVIITIQIIGKQCCTKMVKQVILGHAILISTPDFSLGWNATSHLMCSLHCQKKKSLTHLNK